MCESNIKNQPWGTSSHLGISTPAYEDPHKHLNLWTHNLLLTESQRDGEVRRRPSSPSSSPSSSSLRYQDKGNMREAGLYPSVDWLSQEEMMFTGLLLFFYIQNSIRKRKTDRQTCAVRQGWRSLQLILLDIWLPVSINQCKKTDSNTSVLKLRCPQKSLQTEQNSIYELNVAFSKHKNTMETPLNWTNYEQKCTE